MVPGFHEFWPEPTGEEIMRSAPVTFDNGKDYSPPAQKPPEPVEPLVRIGPMDSEYEQKIGPRPFVITARMVAVVPMSIIIGIAIWFGGPAVLAGVVLGMVTVFILS